MFSKISKLSQLFEKHSAAKPISPEEIEALNKLLSDATKQVRSEKENPEQQILKALKQLISPNDTLIPIRKVRELTSLDKDTFDKTALEMIKGDYPKIGMHYHDFPASVSEEMRQSWVYDPKSKYYYSAMHLRKS